MKELIAEYKFLFIGKCTCLGPRTYKYLNGYYRLYWNMKQRRFTLKHKGKVIVNLKPENEFKDVWEKETAYLPT